MMPGTLQQNGVVERQNRKLKDMVRSMVNNTNFPEFFWSEALKMAAYILSWAPRKVVPNTPFELWTGRKLSLVHLCIWGCPSEIRIYNPKVRKRDLRTVSGLFIGHPERSKRYKFYRPNHSMRIVESNNAKFLEDHEISWSTELRNLMLKEIQNQDVMPIIGDGLVIPHDIIVEQQPIIMKSRSQMRML